MHKHMRSLGVPTLLVANLAMPLSANALLIDRDWVALNDAALTYDTDTGLEWLDVTVTAGLSYNDVTAELGAGGAYEGFSFATRQQILSLFSAVGLQEIPNVPEPMGGGEQIQELLSHWGVTWNLGSGERTEFLTADTDGLNPGEHWSGRVFWLASGDTGVSATLYVRADDYAVSTIGSALVRSVAVVPVPAAAWLLLSGLLGLTGFARCRKELDTIKR